MDFGGSIDFRTDVESAFKVLVDPDVLTARCEGQGHSKVEILSSEASDDGGWVLQSKRVVPLDLPGFAKRILSPNSTVVQTDTWGPAQDGARAGTFEIDVQGAPMRLHGTMTLAPTGEGTSRQDVAGSIEVKVPLIGGKIADWAKGDAQKSLDAEMAFNQKWIDEHEG